MGVAMTSEQRAVQRSIDRWAEQADVLAEVRRREPGATRSDPDTSWAALAELGVLAAGLPEELGGAGGDLLDVACVLETAAGRLVPGPVLPVALAAQLIARFAAPGQAKT